MSAVASLDGFRTWFNLIGKSEEEKKLISYENLPPFSKVIESVGHF